ncbi:MAG: efflux RND transporter periplasmic adaptor subunit [Dechloromonas sp.]|nr:efflux RND transporter periplasmic adaptor subunit [Dechloromonas sp.]
MRHLTLTVALSGLLGLGFYAYAAQQGPSPSTDKTAEKVADKPAAPPARPVAVETAVVRPVDLQDEASAVGTLKANESVVLRPETSGRVAQIGFRDGAVVAKGALLIAFDDAVQAAEVQQARANVAVARNNFKRSQELLSRQFVSPQALEAAAAALQVQEAALQVAQAKAARMRLLAPFRGVVGLRDVSVGDYVKEGETLINIEDIATLRVDFKLPETRLPQLRPGQKVELSSDALPGRTLSARVEASDPQVDVAARALAVRARLDNPAGLLRPGMFVRVRVLFGERSGVLMVPEAAIIPGQQPSVLKVVDGKAQPAKLRLGLRRDALVEVVEGLAAGDVVVTAGQLKLRPGMPVKAVGEGVPAPAKGDAKAAG